ncbi:MAG: hypothetical protein ACQESE_00045 [Nanobdellota archaeon]
MKGQVAIMIISLMGLVLTGCTITAVDPEIEHETQTSSPSQKQGSGIHYGDCPFGNTECDYPGDCGRFIDQDNDGTCDHTRA